MLKFLVTIITITTLASCAILTPVQLERRDSSQSAFLSSFFNNNPSGNPNPLSAASTATSLDVHAFYQNFMSNRYSYVQQYMQFFKTHSFSNIGTNSQSLSSFLTYTDESYTTLIAANPQITSMLSAVATQLPWYSSWYRNQAYVTVVSGSTMTVTPTSTTTVKNDASSFRGPLTQGKMQFLTAQIIAVLSVGAFLFFF